MDYLLNIVLKLRSLSEEALCKQSDTVHLNYNEDVPRGDIDHISNILVKAIPSKLQQNHLCPSCFYEIKDDNTF